MKKDCEIVQDLLPLYVDDVCSPSSREYVDRHIKTCADCQKVLKTMKNDEIETELSEEKAEIINSQAKKFKRKSFLAGAIIAGIFMIPVLICFIVNLSNGQGLSWFFIVLCALMLAASLIIVPLMVPGNKFLWTLATGTASLLLLLGVICIYTGGTWFFVAATAILFGLSIGFMPAVVRSKAVKPYMGNQKSLLCMGVDSVLFWLMMVSIGCQTDNPTEYWGTVLLSALPLFIYAWVVFVIFRYPKFHITARIGICIILTGFGIFAVNNILGMLCGYSVSWPVFSPLRWNYMTIDGNIKWILLIISLVAGGVMMLVGFLIGGKHEKN